MTIRIDLSFTMVIKKKLKAYANPSLLRMVMGHHVKRIITHFAVKKDGKDKISALHLTIR
jgi:hypothetical protein